MINSLPNWIIKRSASESIERFTEGQALTRHALLIPSPVSKLDRRHTGRLRKKANLRTERAGEYSRIIRPQGSLVCYKSLNTLWSTYIFKPNGEKPKLRECLNWIGSSFIAKKICKLHYPLTCPCNVWRINELPNEEKEVIYITGQVNHIYVN